MEQLECGGARASLQAMCITVRNTAAEAVISIT
jgi:hypothetical protein